MNLIIYLSGYIIPFIILFIISYGLYKKVNIYDEFVRGAKEGIKVVINIAPTLVGLMLAVGILRASNIMTYRFDTISDFVPDTVPILFPVILIKLFSSSAATGLVLDIFKEFGPDSYVGRLVSIIMSSTETIFYTMSIYYMSIGIKKTRYTVVGALIATLAGILGSIIVTNLVF